MGAAHPARRGLGLLAVYCLSTVFPAIAQVPRTDTAVCTQASPDPLLVARGLQDAMFCGDGWMMREVREAPGGGIVAESPVWSRGKSEAYPGYGVVHFVFRTRYSNETREWTPVELSDTGEIDETGKPRSAPSWAARYECLADLPRGGSQKA